MHRVEASRLISKPLQLHIWIGRRQQHLHIVYTALTKTAPGCIPDMTEAPLLPHHQGNNNVMVQVPELLTAGGHFFMVTVPDNDPKGACSC